MSETVKRNICHIFGDIWCLLLYGLCLGRVRVGGQVQTVCVCVSGGGGVVVPFHWFNKSNHGWFCATFVVTNGFFFTGRVRSTREGNIYTWECLSVHTGEGGAQARSQSQIPPPPPPPGNGWYLDRLCCGRYTSFGLPQEDFPGFFCCFFFNSFWDLGNLSSWVIDNWDQERSCCGHLQIFPQ